MVFEIENPYSWIFNAISSEKRLPDFNAFPDLLALHQDTRIFRAC